MMLPAAYEARVSSGASLQWGTRLGLTRGTRGTGGQKRLSGREAGSRRQIAANTTNSYVSVDIGPPLLQDECSADEIPAGHLSTRQWASREARRPHADRTQTARSDLPVLAAMR